ncbi:LysR family transcriptional regulator [Granulicella sp. 5B5]|uniref:LysR family transcriptional regulator n=1 Tax=Granulicella sp. 5B5 TaxID=1617967 RepID=UPI0015F56834|nr:LysR substrate-binding domain-containing protein [Granulicella sp. 5B5]QMV17878.1 LysR family transcriptional regulator [Granulicella sp. 5B5]
MELRHLRYFRAIADYGSVTAAAKRLHISQSAISEQILDLEDEVGGRLLDRSSRKIRLTVQGQVFLEEARKTLAAAERAVDLTRQSLQGEVGTLSIGFFLWGSGGFFPRIIREFRRRRPGIRLSLLDMHASEQLVALEEGRIDVGLTRPLEPPFDRTLNSELLYRDPIVVAVRPDHPFARRRVTIKQLADEHVVLCDRKASPVIFDKFVALCAEEGFTPKIVNTSPTWSGVLTLVEAGEGVALVPSGVRHLRTRGLAFSTFEPNRLSLGLSVVWKRGNQGVALGEFLALLGENKAKIQRSGGN